MIRTLKSKGTFTAKASKLAISTAAFGFVTLVSATAAQAEFGDGFREFKQDSCDPLLTGVLTNRGYVDADINALYTEGYDLDAQRGCGFTKLPPVAVNPQPVDPFPVPVDPVPAPPVEPFDPNQFNPIPPVDNTPVIPTIPDVVIPDPVDLPEIEEPATRLANGLYARASAAYMWPKGASGSGSLGNPTDFTFTDSIGQSYGGSLALGYGFNFGGLGPLSNLRTELQASYYDMESEPMEEDTGTNFAIASGNEVLYGGFLNLLADIDVGLPIKPYVGAGIGYGRRDFRWPDNTGATNAGEPVVYKFEADGLLYQAMFGAEFGLTKNATIGLGYKYLKSFDIENAAGAGNSLTPTRTWSIEGRDHHMIEGGLTYKF